MKKVFSIEELPRLSVPDPLFDVRFIHSENITVAFNQLTTGAIVPTHQHIHETIDYVQEGALEMTIGGETFVMGAGTVARVPSHVLHSAKALTDCKVINFFYPKRTDFD